MLVDDISTSRQRTIIASLLNDLEIEKVWNFKFNWGLHASDFPSYLPDVSHVNHSEIVIPAVYLYSTSSHTGEQRTLHQFWNRIEAPDGYLKDRTRDCSSDFFYHYHEPAGLISSIEYLPGVRFVAIDTEANRGRSVAACRGDWNISSKLAYTEALVSFALKRKLIERMDGVKYSYPNLAGFICEDLNYAPYIDKRKGCVEIRSGITELSYKEFSSPTVRVLPETDIPIFAFSDL